MKTLSLAASIFTAATLSVSAQNLVSSGMTNGNYYLLGSGSTAQYSGFLFQSGDSLVELDGPLDDMTGAQRAYGQWMVEWTSNSGTPVYTFKNKATGKTLSLPKNGKATPVGGEIEDFDWMNNVSNTGSCFQQSPRRQRHLSILHRVDACGGY